MYPQTHHSGHHNLRFYIVMITLVVGGIFFLLTLNNSDSEGFSFTGALIGDDQEINQTVELENINQEIDQEFVRPKSEIEKVFTKEIKNSKNEVEFDLSIDSVPKVESKAKVDFLQLKFDDLTTTILVNSDNLELNNLEEVDLIIEGFKGDMEFDGTYFSLDGLAKRIEVDNVALSSKGDIKISFSGLRYNYFDINEIELKDLKFPDSTGDLKISNRLTYSLQSDDLNTYYYKGSFTVNGNTTEPVELEGTARGISISGNSLDVNVN